MQPSSNQPILSRRAFLQHIAGLSTLAGAATLAACAPANFSIATNAPKRAETVTQTQPATTTNTLASTAKAGKPSGATRVAFVKTTDRAQGVQQALALLGMPTLTNKKLVLKPNFNSADPAPGSTHPDVLRTLVKALWAQKASAITLVDRSGMGDTQRVMEQMGVFSLAKALDFNTVILDDLGKNDWEVLQEADNHWKQGFALARPVLEADAVVQACCLKTHRFGGHFTLSLKNSVGLVAKERPGNSYNYMNELHSSPYQRHMIAEINAAYQPSLIVLDGVEAFTSGGPDTGKRVAANVVLAGTDRIAVDAVGVAILRHFGTTPEVSQGAIFEQAQIARAVELGVGITQPDQIELVTGDPASATYAKQIEALLYAV